MHRVFLISHFCTVYSFCLFVYIYSVLSCFYCIYRYHFFYKLLYSYNISVQFSSASQHSDDCYLLLEWANMTILYISSPFQHKERCWEFQESRRCTAFENICLWRILLIPYTDHVTNADVWLWAGSPAQLLPLVQTKRLHFLGMWHGWSICKTCSEPYIRRFKSCPRTKGAAHAQNIHVTPGYGPWKQTFSCSTPD